MQKIFSKMILLVAFSLTLDLSAAIPTKSKYAEYLQLIADNPTTLGPIGNASKGEIEIVLDPQKMIEIERSFERVVGIVAKDKYWIWLNDAVIFPNGKPGVYGRILWRSSLQGPGGVAVMAVLPNGKIVLNRNFRHATRSWEYELPRGVIEKGEHVELAARREVLEETGMQLAELTFLGVMTPDTGLTITKVPVYMATVTSQGDTSHDDGEAIAAIEAFTVDELKQGFRQGYISCVVNGKEEQISLRDPFLAFAFLQATIRDKI